MISQHPDSAIAYAARAEIEVEQQQYEPAEYDYTMALSKEPENQDWLLARANLRIAMKRYSDALDDLDRMVALGTPRSALSEYYRKVLKKTKKRRSK